MRQKCDAVIARDNVEKKVAIEVMKLYHHMENLLLKSNLTRNNELTKYRCDLAKKDNEISLLRKEIYILNRAKDEQIELLHANLTLRTGEL